MKKVISACVDQVLQFDSEQEVDKYVEWLKGKKQLFQIVWKNTLDNGIVQIRVKKQYNNTDFMKEGEK
jgi:hypothetical protein